MATDFTQATVLDFLKERGGQIRSSELVEHFKTLFPEEPQRRATARQTFKKYVDNVAFVRNEDGEKYVCLKKRFRSQGEPEQAVSGPSRYTAAAEQVSGDEAAEERPPRAAPLPRAASLGSSYGNDTKRVPRVFATQCAQPDRGVCGKSAEEADGRSGEMGSKFSSTRGNARSDHALNVPEIKLIAPSPLPVEEDAFALPGRAQVNTGETKPRQEDEWSWDGQSLSGSEDSFTPRESRKHFLELMMNSSPQVRRSLVLRSSVYLPNRSDSDSASYVEEDRTPSTLEPLEHAWMISASDGEWTGLHRLLTSEPTLVLRKDFVSGFTCLHWAAKHNKPDVIALLVNFAKQHSVHLSVDVRSNTGYTPLHVAAMHGHMEVVKLLVGAYSADIEIRDYSGRKASHYLSDGASVNIRDIIGAYELCDVKNEERKAAGGRWRFSKVMQSKTKHRQTPNSSDSDSVDGEGRTRPSIVRRKSSLGLGRMRPNLEKLRLRTSQLVHSSSFRERGELDQSKRPSVLKRKTHFFV